MMQRSRRDSWAHGTLGLIPPPKLLGLLSAQGFSGRLTLVSASTPRRVMALYLDRGRPMLAVGTRLASGVSPGEESYRARQLVIEALTWTAGTFRIEAVPPPETARAQELGDTSGLIAASARRTLLWPKLLHRLPAPLAEIVVAPAGWDTLPDDPVQQAVLQVVDAPVRLTEIAPSCGADEHIVIQAALDLGDKGMLSLGAGQQPLSHWSPQLRVLAERVFEELGGGHGRPRTLKVTVISWDAGTCFRTVEALLGRSRPAPPDIEEQPRYHILHESAAIDDEFELEVFAFRADTFAPELAAPLVQGCHLFLLVTDIEAGHAWGAEKPLIERVDAMRGIFSGAMVAGRVTVGAGAVTDPGCDVVIPELARFVSWQEVKASHIFRAVLREAGACLSS